MPTYDKGSNGNGNGDGKPPVRVKNALPEHFEPRCHVCTSEHRHSIERLIALNTSMSEMQRMFNIDRRSISNHAKEHLSYQQAAIRQIIEHEAKEIQANHEEGLQGVLRYRAYLSTALQKAWEDLVEGNTRIDPAVAIQLIQQMDKFDKESKTAAVDELRYQFNIFMQAVKNVVPRDSWERIAEEAQQLHARSDEGDDLNAPQLVP